MASFHRETIRLFQASQGRGVCLFRKFLQMDVTGGLRKKHQPIRFQCGDHLLEKRACRRHLVYDSKGQSEVHFSSQIIHSK